MQERVECEHEASDALATQGEASRHTDQAVRDSPTAQALGEQRPVVGEVASHDRPLLVWQAGEVHAVGTSAQAGVLADGDHVMSALAKLSGDLGGDVLVEQQLHPEIAARAARQLLSSRSLSAWMRAIRSSTSSRLAP